MIIYVLSWENADMEIMVFSSFEKAVSVAKFILNHLPSFKVSWQEQDDDRVVYHLDYQNEDFDDEDEEEIDDEDMTWAELTIYPYKVDNGLDYLNI